jgi:hypothetical protein
MFTLHGGAVFKSIEQPVTVSGTQDVVFAQRLREPLATA